jgi:hypothetical protein
VRAAVRLVRDLRTDTRLGLRIPDYLLGGVLYGLGNFIRERQCANRSVPPEVVAHRWLTIMSARGPELDCGEQELEMMDDLIGAKEAAGLLGYSARHVRRLKADLDGARPSGRDLVFRRRSVIQYREARKGTP